MPSQSSLKLSSAPFRRPASGRPVPGEAGPRAPSHVLSAPANRVPAAYLPRAVNTDGSTTIGSRRFRPSAFRPSITLILPFLSTALLITTLLTAVTSIALAEPLPAELPIGTGVRLVATTSESATRLSLVVAGRPVEAWDVPLRLEDIAIESAQSFGRPLFVARGRAGAAEFVAVIDPRPRPHVLWRGRLDLRGDPGERVADALERRDLDGDSRPEIVVGQRREGVAACGEAPQLLFARAIDARGVLRAVQPVVNTDEMAVLRGVPMPERSRPVVRGLRFTAPSSTRGQPEEAIVLGPVGALTDEDAATGWAEGRGGAGHGEVLRAQWSGPALTGLELRAGAGVQMPRRMVLRLDEARWVIVVPADAGEHAWVALPAATRASCLSITLADDAVRGADAQLGFTEIVAHSVADAPGGREALIDVLVSDGAEGDRAAGWLAASGTPALSSIAGAWERLGSRGRRRALRVAQALEREADGASKEEIRALRVRAASDDDGEVRGDAIAALARGDDADRAALFEVALMEPASAPLAALALTRGRGIPLGAWDRVAALEPATLDRPALRAAIAIALARHAGWQTAVPESPFTGAALAALGLGLAEARAAGPLDSDTTPLLTSLLTRALESAEGRDDFATRFRIARAARTLEDPALDRWLTETARSAPEWMLRAEAVEALGPRAPRELLGVLLRDSYPRVRLAAARAVARRGGETQTLLALARHDAWPLVRGYALGEVVELAEGRALAMEALNDPASAMRARALELFRTRAGADLDTQLIAVLQDEQEWPHVVTRAVDVAGARCAETLGPALVSVVARGARPNANAGQLEAAQMALRVALSMGGATERDARAAAQGPSAAAFALLLSRPQSRCGQGQRARGVPSHD